MLNVKTHTRTREHAHTLWKTQQVLANAYAQQHTAMITDQMVKMKSQRLQMETLYTR